MTGEDLYSVWREHLENSGDYPRGAILAWGQLPEGEQAAWNAVAEVVSNTAAQ